MDVLDLEAQEAENIIEAIADENEDIEAMLAEATEVIDLKVDVIRLRNKLQTVLIQPQGIADV